MDVVGGVLLADGRDCKIITGIDDHSRFVVCSGIMFRATSRARAIALVGVLFSAVALASATLFVVDALTGKCRGVACRS